MENHQLVFPSRQCSSSPVGYGQGFLSKEQCDSTWTSPILFFKWLQLIFLPVPSSVNSIEGMLLTQLIMRLKSWKGFHKMVSRNFPNTFPIAGRSVYLHKADYFEWNVPEMILFFVFLRSKVIPGTFWSYYVFVEWETFQTKTAEKTKSHNLCSITPFFTKVFPFMR